MPHSRCLALREDREEMTARAPETNAVTVPTFKNEEAHAAALYVEITGRALRAALRLLLRASFLSKANARLTHHAMCSLGTGDILSVLRYWILATSWPQNPAF